jgi:hypothetical protein
MHPSWKDFGDRVRQRAISVLDTFVTVLADLLRALSIIIGDAAILLFGYWATHYLEEHSDPNNRFFKDVGYVSLGAFVLLYLVFIGRHLWKEFREH